MKFTKLVDKFKKLVDIHEQDGLIAAGKLEKLQQLLTDKKSRYEAKLETTKDPEKRIRLETRMKVVNAQLEKSKHLQSSN
jgi:Txe/YoeB family toxin of Txe-Axe toxin-antitoxin module